MSDNLIPYSLIYSVSHSHDEMLITARSTNRVFHVPFSSLIEPDESRLIFAETGLDLNVTNNNKVHNYAFQFTFLCLPKGTFFSTFWTNEANIE